MKLLILSLLLISCDNFTDPPPSEESCTEVVDCAGVCGGNGLYFYDASNNGNCCASGNVDCGGECNGNSILDVCGVCNGNGECICPGELGVEKDCTGVCGGDYELDCAGVCGGFTYVDCAGICDGSAVIDCAGVCEGSSVIDACGVCNGAGIADDKCDCDGNVEDACGVCGGDINSVDECCTSGLCISISNVDYVNNSLDIWMINGVPVSGFQFDITGISDIIPSGGLAVENGLAIASNNNIILGFSFSGASIPSNSNGVLIHITYTDISDDICIVNAIFSDPTGTAIGMAPIDCFSIIR